MIQKALQNKKEKWVEDLQEALLEASYAIYERTSFMIGVFNAKNLWYFQTCAQSYLTTFKDLLYKKPIPTSTSRINMYWEFYIEGITRKVEEVVKGDLI